jgi:citrate synthase
MDLLRRRLETQFRESRQEINSLVGEHGELVIDSVALFQLYGGMRGIRGLVCDTSSVDPELGLKIRGLPVSQLKNRCPEEIFWLLLTSYLPDERELLQLREYLHSRRKLPDYVSRILQAMPADTHPMTMFNAGILAMQHNSHFAVAYGTVKREELWFPALLDALDLLARLPVLAALVYRMRYALPELEEPNELDWTRDFARRLLGRDNADFESILRCYVVVQSDHESGNACAFAGHITGSTHADLYHSVSAGLNGLAGHIHGLAAQDFMRFLLDIGQELPESSQPVKLRRILRERLANGMVIPGFGHAVLRQQDPRFEILHDMASQRHADHELFMLAERIYKAGTQVLIEQGRVKNPYPNVDAITGVLLSLSGISQLEFYTVLFGTSLSIGMLAQNVISRGIGSPIVRPRSLSTAQIRRLVSQDLSGNAKMPSCQS